MPSESNRLGGTASTSSIRSAALWVRRWEIVSRAGSTLPVARTTESSGSPSRLRFDSPVVSLGRADATRWQSRRGFRNPYRATAASGLEDGGKDARDLTAILEAGLDRGVPPERIGQ